MALLKVETRLPDPPRVWRSVVVKAFWPRSRVYDRLLKKQFLYMARGKRFPGREDITPVRFHPTVRLARLIAEVREKTGLSKSRVLFYRHYRSPSVYFQIYCSDRPTAAEKKLFRRVHELVTAFR
jgi:hypothetical protein